MNMADFSFLQNGPADSGVRRIPDYIDCRIDCFFSHGKAYAFKGGKNHFH
jgi:hypothetical protein